MLDVLLQVCIWCPVSSACKDCWAHPSFFKGWLWCVEHHGIASALGLTGVVVSAQVHIAAQANKLVARLTSR